MKLHEGVLLGPPDPVSAAGRGQHLKLPMHRHDSLEIAFLERGHVRWKVEGRPPDEVHEGMVFYTFPWETHGSADEYDPGHYFHFVLLRGDKADPYKSPMSFQSLGLKKSIDAELMRILESSSQRSWPASERLAMTIRELVEETLNPKVRSEEIRTALAKFLLLELARIVSEGAESQPKIHTPPKVRKLLKDLSVRLEHKWTLPDMAAACGLHLTHFTKAFRHATGDTPMVYLRRLRINRAREMLQTKASVTEIAFACGFESSQHFARIFREFTGQSASEYRKNPRS